MRALPCLTLLAALASTGLHPATEAASPISRGQGIELKNDVEGHYRLQNNRIVRLVQVDEQLYLDLNRRYRQELLPAGRNFLASRDGKLTVQYMPEGPVARILIEHPELPANVRLGESSWRGR